MSYCLTYKIKDIDGEFRMPIEQGDDVQYISNFIKSDFGIIPRLTAKIYGSDLQGSSILSQSVRGQDVVTFVPSNPDGTERDLEMYRQPVITPRYKSKNVFMVFTTLNYNSMVNGDKIQVDVEKDTFDSLEKKIKEMLSKTYKNIPSDALKNKILIFLPGGIPFLKGTIEQFIKSFPEFMPHLYVIFIKKKEINDEMLKTKFGQICNIKDPKLKLLLSPSFESKNDGLCYIATSLGYIQQDALNVKRMIYSIAKFCPFAPMICGLYDLSCLSQVTGRTIIQITAPLSTLFLEMSKNFQNRSNLFTSAIKFFTYFMNINISDRVPCTEFTRPFYDIGYEKYFHDVLSDSDIETFIAFDPDFRDQDWIKFELPSLKDDDFKSAEELTNSMSVVPPMSLREMHRTAIFQGKNGPWLFLTASISKEEKDKESIEYINPETGSIEKGKYEDIAVKTINVDYKVNSDQFDKEVLKTIDDSKVTQLVFICVDKSGSMRSGYDSGFNRFQASQKFFIRFTEACYRFHTTSLYGAIMFNGQIDVRNRLNPLASNFKDRMVVDGEQPNGGTALFKALKRAGELMIEANRGPGGKPKYPNAVLRVIAMSDGRDIYENPASYAQISNFLLQNKIRVDAFVVSSFNDVAPELVTLARASGGVTMLPRTIKEGLNLFNREEFFNVDLREFGPMHPANLTASDFSSKGIRPEDINSHIPIRANEFIKNDKKVTSPLYAICSYDKQVEDQIAGKIHDIKQCHPNQKRIIYELRKIIDDPDEEVRVYPLKDRVDVWRVLIKGFPGSLYESKWFYLIIEFPPDYPQHYPLFRFVKPPFHPNITDQGRVCIKSLDQTYKSDKSIRELIGTVRYLLFEPNFADTVDDDRNGMSLNSSAFRNKVNDWNNRNGKDTPEEWIASWKIEPDDGVVTIAGKQMADIPEQFLCPIKRKIMSEPVKASSGAYYEKSALEKYIRSTDNPTCRVLTGPDGKPIPLPAKDNLNLPIDLPLKNTIMAWKKENNYIEDKQDDSEVDNISFFRKKGGPPVTNVKTPANVKLGELSNDNSNNNFNRFGDLPPPRNRRPLTM